MRHWGLVVAASLAVANGGAASPKPTRLDQDWPRLTGTWVTPFRKTPDFPGVVRLRLTFRTAGEQRLVDASWENWKPSGERAASSTMLIVSAVRERQHTSYLVVRPSGQLPHKFEKEIRYQFRRGKLRLAGSVGPSNLTGDWSRLPRPAAGRN